MAVPIEWMFSEGSCSVFVRSEGLPWLPAGGSKYCELSIVFPVKEISGSMVMWEHFKEVLAAFPQTHMATFLHTASMGQNNSIQSVWALLDHFSQLQVRESFIRIRFSRKCLFSKVNSWVSIQSCKFNLCAKLHNQKRTKSSLPDNLDTSQLLNITKKVGEATENNNVYI